MNTGLVYSEYSYDLVSRPGYTSGVSASTSTQATGQLSPEAHQPPDRQLDDKNIASSSHLDATSDHYVLGGEKYSLLDQTDCVQVILVAEMIKEGQKRILSEGEGLWDKANQNADVFYNPQEIYVSRDSLDYDIGVSWQHESEDFRTDTAGFNCNYPSQKDSFGLSGEAAAATVLGSPAGTMRAFGAISGPSSGPLHQAIENFSAVDSRAETKLHVSLGVEFDIGTGSLPVNFNRTKEKGTGMHMEELAQQILVEQKVRMNDELKMIADKGDDRLSDRETMTRADQNIGIEDRFSGSEKKDPRPLLERSEEYQSARNEIRLHHELEYNTTPPESPLLIDPLPPTLGLRLEVLSLDGSSEVASSKPGRSAVEDYIPTKNVTTAAMDISRPSSTNLYPFRELGATYKADGPPISLGLESTDTYNLELNPIPTITEAYDVTTLGAAPVYISTDYGSNGFQLNTHDLEHFTSYRQMSPIILNLQRLPMTDELDRDRVNLVSQAPPEQTVQVLRPENHFDHSSHYLVLTKAERVPEVPTDFVNTQKHITLMHNPEKHVDHARTENIVENQLYGRDDPRIQEVINLKEIREADKFEKQTEYLEGRHTVPVEKVRGEMIPDSRAGHDALSGLVWGWRYKQ
jgi:hypothetical protein